jgi:von Willebrand factor type A domain
MFNCKGCRQGADVAILVDVSGNLSPENVQLEIDFVFDMVLNGLSLDSGRSRLSLVTYASSPDVRFYLSNFTSRAAVLNAINVYHSLVLLLSSP